MSSFTIIILRLHISHQKRDVKSNVDFTQLENQGDLSSSDFPDMNEENLKVLKIGKQLLKYL